MRTDGAYYDQRAEGDRLKTFDFVGAPVNLTFRYDPARYEQDPDRSINVRAKVADDFRTFYAEPTLFTEWRVSLPKGGGGGAISREALQNAVRGITLEFSGKYLKARDRIS